MSQRDKSIQSKMTASNTHPVRLNGRSSTRKPAQTTSNDTGRLAMKSNPSGTTPSNKLQIFRSPEARTPMAACRPTSALVPSPNPNPSSQTPILKLTREIKSRLPRVATTPISQKGPSLSNPDTKRLRVKKSSNQNANTSNLAASTPSSLVTLSPHKSPSHSESNLLSESSNDPDKTPQKSYLGRAPREAKQAPVDRNATKQLSRSKGPDVQAGNIIFPTIVEDLTPKRPMTRARTKHLLNVSATSSQASSQAQTTGIPVPQIKRKTSRVIEIAKAFQSQSSGKLEVTQNSSNKLARKSSQSLLGVTPDRRKSDASNSSLVSPSGSTIGNSPNISALAASLSKQFGQREKSNRGRPSVTDMLRYSTMSTLGELQWEDGADEVLLTDPNETEAMVADISMTKMTPLKSEVQSAAIALASARANFLSIVQENEAPVSVDGQTGAVHENLKDVVSPSSQLGLLKRKTSASSLPFNHLNNGFSPLSRTRINFASSSNSPTNRAIAHEAQLASLSTSLEKSRQREIELENEIKKLVSKQSEDTILKEREKNLEEENKRLEFELDECKEINIELENSLDLVRFENQENIKKINSLISTSEANQQEVKLEEPHQKTINSMMKNHHHHHYHQDDKDSRFSKYNEFNKNLSDHLSFIKESLEILQVIKVSLALSGHLFSSSDVSSSSSSSSSQGN